MPRFDNVLDEPEDRRPTKTDTKKANPFSHLDDLDAFDITGKAPAKINPTSDKSKGDKATASTPNMPKASAASTREKTSRITPGDEMRDYLSRINFNADDEISDAEAARRAGHSTDNNTLPSTVTRQNLPAILNRQLQAAGEQMPEWHTINNLPGYMARNIRAMGRQFFSMFTRTPLESIMTIANVQGQGPNSDAELRAVGAWLLQNGEDLGNIEVDMGPAIQGYRPEVKEFSANGIRFHVVRDPMGQYIYAYPEQDAVQHGGRLGAEQGHRPRLPQRESIMNKNAILEGILNSDLAMESQELSKWTQRIVTEMMLAERGSTLSKLIGASPGGYNLVKWLHSKDRLSATAAWSEVTKTTGRVQWEQFKSDPTHFMVVAGKTAVVAIKPDEQSFAANKAAKEREGEEYNPSKDNKLMYNVVGFAKDRRIDNMFTQMPSEKDFDSRAEYEMAVRRVKEVRGKALNLDAPATKFNGKRGGKPFGKDPHDNLWDNIKEVIGGINAIYTVSGNVDTLGDKPLMQRKARQDAMSAQITGHEPGEVPAGPENWPRTKGGVDTAKYLSRNPRTAQGPADFNTEFSTIVNRIRPMFPKLIQKAETMLFNRAARLQHSDNFDAQEQLIKVKRMFHQFKVAVDTSGDISPSSDPIVKIIGGAIKDATGVQRLTSQEGAEVLRDLNSGGAAGLNSILATIVNKLITVAS